MSDGTRRAILARLAESDARVTELASEFPISLNSTSKHIRILERARLVTANALTRPEDSCGIATVRSENRILTSPAINPFKAGPEPL